MRTVIAVVTTSWGLVMALAPLLQARIVLRTRDSSHVSIGWLSVLLVGFSLWFLYGISIRSIPIMISNVVSLIAAIVTFAIVLRFRATPVTTGESAEV